MHSRRRSWWATSLAVGPIVFAACAAPVQLYQSGEGVPGTIAATLGRRSVVIAAPHGTSDARTGDIVAELGRRTGFSVVVARGFDLEPDTLEQPGRRSQVNRPFEGVPGRPPAEDIATESARRVYDAYERKVREAAQGPLDFYAELHGNNHRDAASRIETATVGVDRDEAIQPRPPFELTRDAHLRGNREAPSLAVLVEPGDTIRYAASGAKRDGILRLARRALHIELPRGARTEWREVYTADPPHLPAPAGPLPR